MRGPRIIRFRRDEIPPEALAEAVQVLRAGGIVAHPTETVYGLAADPWNPGAVGRILALKGKGEEGGLIVIAASTQQAGGLLAPDPPRLFAALAAAFWPGPLTIVAPPASGAPAAAVPVGGGLAVRVTSGEVARRLVEAAGFPLISTSANRTGEPPAGTGEEVAGIFGEGVDLILEGGPGPVRLPSTVVDLTCDPPRILREGAVSRLRVEEVVRRSGGGRRLGIE